MSKKWIQNITMKKGAFTQWCKHQGYNGVTQECIAKGKASKNSKIRKRAVLAETFIKMRRRK